MLSFAQKLEILNEFPQLSQKKVSLGRINFQFEGSAFEKKNIVYHLHPNGNGFVYAGLLPDYKTDEKGYVNIRDFTEASLRGLIKEAIASLSEIVEEAFADEVFINENDFTLLLVKEGGLYNIYADELLDGTFKTYPAAVSYLEQEGFKRKHY